MKTSILVCYATATGTTADIAEIIAETLRDNGRQVDLFNVEDNPALDNYGAVVLGSAVQYGTWLPTALDWAKAHRDLLIRRPVAVFNVHIQNTGADIKSRHAREAYLAAIREIIIPVDSASFAGRFSKEAAQMLLPRWFARLVPVTDSRKPRQIKAWAAQLPGKLFPAKT